jgi:hypothetical protein
MLFKLNVMLLLHFWIQIDVFDVSIFTIILFFNFVMLLLLMLALQCQHRNSPHARHALFDGVSTSTYPASSNTVVAGALLLGRVEVLSDLQGFCYQKPSCQHAQRVVCESLSRYSKTVSQHRASPFV